MSEGVEHTFVSGSLVAHVPAVLQPRMSEGVEHRSRLMHVWRRCWRCYNLGCRKALSTIGRIWHGGQARLVLQPRMSEGVEHTQQQTQRSGLKPLVLQPRMSEGVEHAAPDIDTRDPSQSATTSDVGRR